MTGTAPHQPESKPVMTTRWPTVQPWLSTLTRLALGAVWIAAGAAKVADLAESVRAVRAYRLLPESVVPIVGAGLPFVEIALGLLLIAGVGTRLAAIVTVVVLAVFVVGIISAWTRGLRIECGCFGGGGDLAAAVKPAYGPELARDVGLVALGTFLAWWPLSRWSLDALLFGATSFGPTSFEPTEET
jgi:uncharacterized membrane protein YphA (DoxX/SURF4 family)